jgi:essential nuclear protein 1
MQLLRKKNHPKVTPEIRRELQAARPRDTEMGASLKCEEGEEHEMDVSD